MKRRKKIALKRKILLPILFLLSSLSLVSCNWDEIFSRSVDIKFIPYWGDQMIYGNLLDSLAFENHNGETMSIHNLKFIVSNVEFTKTNGDTYTTENEYAIFNLQPRKQTFSIGGDEILPSGYYDISFTFGLSDELNIDGLFPDIDNTFTIPSILGGGYYFMNLDGQFLDTNNSIKDYNLYANRAIDNTDPQNPVFTDTSYRVNLGSHYITGGVFYAAVKIKVDISQWFKNPNTWDLNLLNNDLTENYDAQIKLGENNETVFTYDGIETD